jgi:hypothetical protein
MKRLLLSFAWLFCFANLATTQTVLEDFEPNAKLTWTGDTVLNVINKPAGGDTLGINPSARVGSYTKVRGKSFSLLVATLPQPLNMTTNNQFRIQVRSSVATSFILKLEGTGGQFIEEKKKIGVRNQWIEYRFNFSAARSFTTLNKIILFFDPGVDSSSNTYLFDNLIQEGGTCSNVVKNNDIIDDFECQRNGVYGDPGYLDITAVDNPDRTGVDTSARVGRYTDRNGAFHALVIPFPDLIPLTADKNQVKIKVWAPKAGRLLAKLEGGGSPAKEVGIQITEINKWVEYTFDFSDQVGANHRALVFFFNAGVEMAAGDIYFIDDIQIGAKVVPGPLEDFEPNPKLTWELLFATNGGTFNGAINNPDKTGVNTTDRVGSYTKGTSRLGGLKAAISRINLNDFPQIDLQVWAPTGAQNLTLQLSSPSQGVKEVTRPITETRKWVQLSFNFDAFKTITDFEEVRILFDQNLMTTDTWYFDNLRQVGTTVDPCEGTVRNNNFIDDFDCQRNSTITGGATALKIVNNPFPGGINPNPLDKVGEYTDPINEPFAALVFRRDTAFNLSTFNQLHVKIYSTKAVPIGFKLEGGTSPFVEIVRNVTQVNQWVEYVIDFSAQAAANHRQVTIFFNFGVSNTTADVYHIDDVEWRRAPYKGCIATFENPTFSVTTWRYFANGSLDMDPFQIVDNPNKSGINTSDKVGLFRENAMGMNVSNFAGAFAALQAPIELGASRTVKMKVLSPTANSFVMKLESPVGTALASGDIRASYTTPGQWQELTWDFSRTQGGMNIAVGSQYNTLTIIPDFDNIPSMIRNHYFDDITVGEGTCMTTGIFDPVIVESLKVFPNPAYNELIVQNADKIDLFVIYNAVGQRLSVVQPNGTSNLTITLDHLSKGMYVLAGYNEAGTLVANARFVKQ